MGRRRFEVSATLPASPEDVIDLLVDLGRHRGLHPFLTSAVMVGSGTSAEGVWRDWRVEERPTLGPLRYRLRFPVRTLRTSATSMTALVRAAPGCWLCSASQARPDRTGGAGSQVVETTVVTAPWPVLGYMARTAEAAHGRTFSALPDVLG